MRECDLVPDGTSEFEIAETYNAWVSLAAVYVFEALFMQPPRMSAPFQLPAGPGSVAKI